jgi:hypothetical protein
MIGLLIRWFKSVALLCLIALFLFDYFSNGYFFQHNPGSILLIWMVLVIFLFILREFLLNGNEVVDARRLATFPTYTNFVSTFDKEGYAKVPRRLIFERKSK